MLQLEWDGWWTDMLRLQAEEQRMQFVIAQAADSGWKFDRKDLLNRWERFTLPKRTPEPVKDLVGQMQRFADWVAYQWGGFGSGVKRDGG